MAGEWIKMECATPDKPEVLALTVRMGWDDPDLTVGKLFRLWRWFDQQTIDGNAHGVTPALLDKLVGVTGFVQAVADVGWLTINSDGVRLSNFDAHNGATAKSRALTAKRVANHRASEPSNGEGNAPSVTPALAREEKRREEKKEKDSEAKASSSAATKKPKSSRKVPEAFVVDTELLAWHAEQFPGVNLSIEIEKFRDHTFKNPITDWPGAFRNWVRNAASFGPARAGANGSRQAALEARNRAVIDEYLRETQ